MDKKYVIYVCGPAGCGKTTVATMLSKELKAPYVEGDAMHPESNIKKMSADIPLTDEDRIPWLKILRTEAEKLAYQKDDIKKKESEPQFVVVTCSALKKKYRDILRESDSKNLTCIFVFLLLDLEDLLQRVRERQNHYMKESMVQSQLAIFEVPQDDETDVIKVDVQNKDRQYVESTVKKLVFERVFSQ